jgi:ABC-type nitrate/sulfonate/bicarbonate transport system permease component
MSVLTRTAAGESTPGVARQRALTMLTALLVGLVGWQIIVWTSGGWVPSLADVGQAMVEDLVSVEVWQGALITFRRLLIGFAGSMLIGVTLGFLMGLLRSFDAFWRPLIVVALAIPDPVYFIVAILILGTEESTGLIALILAVVPFVVTIVVGAVSSRDKGLDEMSSVYRLPTSQYLVQVLGRQLVPALLAAARTAFAFAWKIVVLMEALTQPDGIGAQIYYAFRLLRPAHMISLALIFILVMRAIEWLAFTPLESGLLRWQT